MAATDEIVKIAIETLPDLATLVPERRQELTTEGGLDVRGHKHLLRDVVKELQRHEIQVSLFIDPVPDQIEASRETGANKIEIHTGEYANARTEREQHECLQRVQKAAEFASNLGLGVNAGHGLNYVNIMPIRLIPQIEEVSIGHALISRAVFVGLERAVNEMVTLVR